MATDVPAALRAQAITLRAQAERLDQLADMVEDGAYTSGDMVGFSPVHQFEQRLRDLLSENPVMYEERLIEATGLPAAAFRSQAKRLIDAGKLLKSGHGAYTWLWAEPVKETVTEARTLAPAPSSVPKGAIVPERGKPVRTSARTRSRKVQSTAGQGLALKNKDRAYEREQAAKAARAEKQRQAAKKKPKTLSATAAARRAENKARAEAAKERHKNAPPPVNSGRVKRAA